MLLYTRKHGGEEDRDESKQGRRCAKLGHHAKRARQGSNPADKGHQHAKLDSAASANVIALRHGVEVLGANEDVEGLNKGVVEDEHDGGPPPSPFLAPKQSLAEITDVADLGVAEAEFPHNQAGVENKGSNDDSQDDARHEPQIAVRPREAHNGEADVLAKEQSGRLLP